MANILFIHQNFPAQFVHLAPALAERGHNVMAMSDVANRRADLSGVTTWYYKSCERARFKGLGSTFVTVVNWGDMVAGACQQLLERTGFVPDVIFGHNGWGEMLFLREVWPEAKIINYAELVYRSRGLDSDFDPEFQSSALKARVATAAKASHILQSMLDADMAVSPTKWQAASFPPVLRDKITVVHDGVNTDEARPDPNKRVRLPNGRMLKHGDEVLTFVNRNLEPYRGYHIFMRALPAIMAARPEAQVVIVGGDSQSYGSAPSAHGFSGTWKQRFLDEVADRINLARVHFVGQVPRAHFLALMQITRVHAYLTYPFVLSWSMVEAMSAGALVVGSRTGPVEEVIRDGVNGRLVDFFDVDGWSKTIIGALSDPAADAPLREAARETVLKKFDLHGRCLPRQIKMIERLAAGSPNDEPASGNKLGQAAQFEGAVRLGKGPGHHLAAQKDKAKQRALREQRQNKKLEVRE